MEVNVLAELERTGIGFEWAGENDVRCRCPFHRDETPSCSVNVETGLFKCHAAGCSAKGDIVSLLATYLKVDRSTVLYDLGKRYKIENVKLVDPGVVEECHQRLKKAGPLLKELKKRGVTDELVRKYRLGERDGRITIPVKNESGLYVNMRLYLPGAPGRNKMRNLRRRGTMRLYPVEQLEYGEIVVTGGEIKAIVAADRLNRFGIGAVTATGGEGNWDARFTPSFRDKKVWICLDVDEGGRKSSRSLCTHLHRIAGWTGEVLLPLDVDKYPHGDVNDFVASEKGDLHQLLKDTPEFKLISETNSDAETENVTLNEAVSASASGRRLRLKTVVTAMDTAPYVIPKDVHVECDRSQKECMLCSVFAADSENFHVDQESEAILDMVGSTRASQRESLMRAIGVPCTCKSCDVQVMTFHNVEDVRISPQLEITTRSSERVMQPALCVGDGAELNETYWMTGRMYPHPRTQQSTLVIGEYEPAKDALSTYVPQDVGRLGFFRPDKWTIDSLRKRLNSMYDDLEANVTRIYSRRAMHLVADLAWHSPLLITFDGRVVKGWAEVLILGDSSQGKSETVLGLMNHYGLGEKVECKNASVAGLLGGLQQLGSRWFVTWGVIPTHDRRLVVLEELKGANTEIIAKLTDMRSSGVAEIPKIEKRKTHARTRLVALSNPRSDMPVRSYSFAVTAIKELIGSLEDVRRFDMCLIVSASEIDPAILNKLYRARPKVDHRHTQELCRSLILWSWTRTPEQVVFDEQTSSMILDAATKLSDEFSDVIPLIDRGSTRYKLARLASALACRTFSTEDTESVVVRPCHVDFVVDFVRKVYGSQTFGYADLTAAVRLTAELSDPKLIEKHLNETPFPTDFVQSMLHTERVDLQDIQDWCGWDRHEAIQFLSFLVRKHALQRDGRAYRKTPPFISLLKNMQSEGRVISRPDFIGDEF